MPLDKSHRFPNSILGADGIAQFQRASSKRRTVSFRQGGAERLLRQL
jgi:hypothetical protein